MLDSMNRQFIPVLRILCMYIFLMSVSSFLFVLKNVYFDTLSIFVATFSGRYFSNIRRKHCIEKRLAYIIEILKQPSINTLYTFISYNSFRLLYKYAPLMITPANRTKSYTFIIAAINESISEIVS